MWAKYQNILINAHIAKTFLWNIVIFAFRMIYDNALVVCNKKVEVLPV